MCLLVCMHTGRRGLSLLCFLAVFGENCCFCRQLACWFKGNQLCLFKKLQFLQLKIFYCIDLYLCSWASRPRCKYGGQRRSWRRSFSPSPMCILRLQLRHQTWQQKLFPVHHCVSTYCFELYCYASQHYWNFDTLVILLCPLPGLEVYSGSC